MHSKYPGLKEFPMTQLKKLILTLKIKSIKILKSMFLIIILNNLLLDHYFTGSMCRLLIFNIVLLDIQYL